ncbi:radical SAM protein [Candidatus Woesearchaeota archaeon]|nr:radical SAM protein [Candidatus Woesearchaeota archaeon]
MLLLVNSPFCTPASPSYSLTYLYTFLKNNSKLEIDVFDANLLFHQLKFAEYGEYFQLLKNILAHKETFNDKKIKKSFFDTFEKKSNDYKQTSFRCYSENNKKIVLGQKPEYFAEVLNAIVAKNPKYVAFSVVYFSQAFYTQELILALKEKGIKTIVGGPGVTAPLKKYADYYLENEVLLLELLKNGEEESKNIEKKDRKEYNKQQEHIELDHSKLNVSRILDYSIWPLDRYFISEPVISLRTNSACYYQQCAFCTHHQSAKYLEYKLEDIRDSIIASGVRNVYFSDDMISTKRLLALAEVLKPLEVSWTCQLRPTRDLTSEILKTLHDSGLKMIMWGIESGSDRILNLMKKQTNTKDIAAILKSSKEAGIVNVAYILFGFPTETKEEFLETIKLLKDNSEQIDLVSTTIFGLQKESPMYETLEEYGISGIQVENRTVLDPKITYTVSSGLSHEEVKKLRRGYAKTINNISKFPASFNFFREQMLCFVGKN